MTRGKKTEKLSVVLEEDLFVDLLRLAAAADRTVSEYARFVFRTHCRGHAMRLEDDDDDSIPETGRSRRRVS